MPRIFWSKRRKAQLLIDAKTLTLKQMARKHFRPTDEIERILSMLRPGKKTIVRRYKENGVVVKVYKKGYAYGSEKQMIGEHRPYY